jgi:hypothetical protein
MARGHAGRDVEGAQHGQGARAVDQRAWRHSAGSAAMRIEGQRWATRARKRRAKPARSTWPGGRPASSWSRASRSCQSRRPSSLRGAQSPQSTPSHQAANTNPSWAASGRSRNSRPSGVSWSSPASASARPPASHSERSRAVRRRARARPPGPSPPAPPPGSRSRTVRRLAGSSSPQPVMGRPSSARQSRNSRTSSVRPPNGPVSSTDGPRFLAVRCCGCHRSIRYGPGRA